MRARGGGWTPITHIAMVVEHHVYAVGVRQIEDRVQPPHKVGVQCILIARLRARPDHAEANGVPAVCLEVAHVGLVECGAADACASGRACAVDGVIAHRIA